MAALAAPAEPPTPRTPRSYALGTLEILNQNIAALGEDSRNVELVKSAVTGAQVFAINYVPTGSSSQVEENVSSVLENLNGALERDPASMGSALTTARLALKALGGIAEESDSKSNS